MHQIRTASISALLAGLFVCGAAHAEDRWNGPDKQQHFSISVATGKIGLWAAQDVFGAREYAPMLGAVLGQLPGLARELYQGRKGQFSHRDHAYNIAGAIVGAYFGPDLIFKPTVSRTGRTDGIIAQYRIVF